MAITSPRGHDSTPRVIPDIARREWPLVEAAVVPTVLLALAWAGVWSRETGAALALGSAILQITGWGFVAGLRSGGSPLSAVALGAGQGGAWCCPARPRETDSLIEFGRRSHTHHVMTAHPLGSQTALMPVDRAHTAAAVIA